MGRSKSFENLAGCVFGRLTVVSEAMCKNNNVYWNCICKCGNTHQVTGSNLRSGDVTSCGCYRNEVVGSWAKTHGMSKDLAYSPWKAMKKRCSNPNDSRYAYYGGRGIKVCKEWQDSFVAFYNQIGPRPTPEHTLDRINPDGNYEPGNVRWATRKEQANNKRPRKKKKKSTEAAHE